MSRKKEAMEQKQTNKHLIPAKHYLFAIIGCVLSCLYILLVPNIALAAEGPFDFSFILEALQNVVSWFLLPLAIVWVAWKFVYLAVFVGFIGFDPLHLVPGSNDDAVSYGQITGELKKQALYTIKGLCWIGGIFIIFRIVVIVASSLAGVFGEAFS